MCVASIYKGILVSLKKNLTHGTSRTNPADIMLSEIKLSQTHKQYRIHSCDGPPVATFREAEDKMIITGMKKGRLVSVTWTVPVGKEKILKMSNGDADTTMAST